MNACLFESLSGAFPILFETSWPPARRYSESRCNSIFVKSSNGLPQDRRSRPGSTRPGDGRSLSEPDSQPKIYSSTETWIAGERCRRRFGPSGRGRVSSRQATPQAALARSVISRATARALAAPAQRTSSTKSRCSVPEGWMPDRYRRRLICASPERGQYWYSAASGQGSIRPDHCDPLSSEDGSCARSLRPTMAAAISTTTKERIAAGAALTL